MYDVNHVLCILRSNEGIPSIERIFDGRPFDKFGIALPLLAIGQIRQETTIRAVDPTDGLVEVFILVGWHRAAGIDVVLQPNDNAPLGDAIDRRLELFGIDHLASRAVGDVTFIGQDGSTLCGGCGCR